MKRHRKLTKRRLEAKKLIQVKMNAIAGEPMPAGGQQSGQPTLFAEQCSAVRSTAQALQLPTHLHFPDTPLLQTMHCH